MTGQWLETTVHNLHEFAELVGMLGAGETFALHDGHGWTVGWDDSGEEFWVRPRRDDDPRTDVEAVVVSGEDQEFPITYVHRMRENWQICQFCEELTAGHSPEEMASCAAEIASAATP